MSPARGRFVTPSRPEDAPKFPDRGGKQHLPHRETHDIAPVNLPAAARLELLERPDVETGLDPAIELEAERIYGHVENLGPGDAWVYAVETATRRICG